MNNLSIYTLKALRRLYAKTVGAKPTKPECEQDADKASQIIYEALMDDKPCMIARFGSTELSCLVNYLGVKQQNIAPIKFIKGVALPWWWNESIINQMQQWSGFFPPTHEKIEQFCELMLHDIPEVDILGSWLADEKLFEKELEQAPKIWLDFLNPFFSKNPWSRALENKKILVVHPFSQTIKRQYTKRELLFKDINVLPKFELQIIKAVQSLGSGSIEFNDWFEALQYMKNEIDKCDYDICLIGAGAYGFPLAAHVKRSGKKAVHLGGSLQLLFGIKGKRWEDPNLNKDYSFADFINEYWVRPSEDEKPLTAQKVENACYW